MKQPNDSENDYMSDSDNEYTQSEKIQLETRRSILSHRGGDSEEEVYGLLSSSDESDNEQENEIADDIASDIEDNKSDDLPDSRAWGQRRRHFYNTDYVDPDYAGIQGKDSESAELEELEARNIQERLAEQLDAGTEFSLDVLATQMDPVVLEENLEGMPEPLIEEKIQTDLSKLTKRQKLDLIKKESPELFGLVNDFKGKMTEIIEKWQPMMKLFGENKLTLPLVEKFVQTKHGLILNYCTHIGFYLLLKCMRLPVQSHPVIKRLFQLRQLLGSLSQVGENITDQIDHIIQKVSECQEVTLKNPSDEEEDAVADKSSIKKKRRFNFLHQSPGNKKIKAESDNEKVMVKSVGKENKLFSILKPSKVSVLQGRGRIEKEKRKKQGEDENAGDTGDEGDEESGNVVEGEAAKGVSEEEGKRAITYQMAKNKGLTPRRKKEQRNPRVKHRNKYRRALIRRKGQVRQVRMETKRYDGEISGIKAGVSKSIKIK